MTLSLANSVEEVEPGGSGCNTQSDSDSESSNSFRFTDVKDVKLMTGAPATTTSVVFKDSPYATVGDTINIHIVKANINGKEFEKYTNHNIDIPCESNDDVETNQVEAHSPINPTIHYEMNHTRFFDHPKIFLILVGLVAVGVVYLITSNQSSPIEYGRYVSREEWGAAPPRGALTRRSQLATLVVIKHTWGDTCSNYDSCKSRVKDLQECHMNKIKLLDIAYNFLVGGDGRIYEGLGWGWENIVRNDSIDIAFIGDFNDAVPSDKMLSTAVYLIDLGWDEKWIDKNNYHVVGDNQTEPANSPGANLFAMLPRWFNHYSETALCFFGCSEERCNYTDLCP